MSTDPLRIFARFQAELNGLDPDAFERQIEAESGFNPQAVSPKGARGIAQFMPETGRRYGLNTVVDLHDPMKAIPAMAKHMADLKTQAGGDEQAARVGYNAGPARMRNYQSGKSIPTETEGYLKQIGGDDPEAMYKKFRIEAGLDAPDVLEVAPQTGPIDKGKIGEMTISAGLSTELPIPRSVSRKIGGSTRIDVADLLDELDAKRITPEQFKAQVTDRYATQGLGFEEHQLPVARQWAESQQTGYDPFALLETPEQLITQARASKGQLGVKLSARNAQILESLQNSELLNPMRAQAERTSPSAQPKGTIEKAAANIQSAATTTGAGLIQIVYNLWKLSGAEKPVESELSRKLLEQAQAEAEQAPGAVNEIARGLLTGLFETPKYIAAASGGPAGFAALGAAEQAHKGLPEAAKAATMNAIIGLALGPMSEMPIGTRAPYAAGVGAAPSFLEAATQGATPEEAALAAIPGAVQMGALGLLGGKRNAKAIRSDEGQVRERRAEGQPEVQRGANEGGEDLQQQASRSASDQQAAQEGQVAPSVPRETFHKLFGKMDKAADQSGVPAGKERWIDVKNGDEHIVGPEHHNQYMVRLKPGEAPPETIRDFEASKAEQARVEEAAARGEIAVGPEDMPPDLRAKVQAELKALGFPEPKEQPNVNQPRTVSEPVRQESVAGAETKVKGQVTEAGKAGEAKAEKVSTARTMMVNGESVTAELTPENATKFDAIDANAKTRRARFQEQLDQVKPNSAAAQEIQAQMRALAMRIAAEKRALHPNLRTAGEQSIAAKRERTNYIGKQVEVGGRSGKIVGNPFGRVKVQFEDGKTATFAPADVTARKVAAPKGEVAPEQPVRGEGKEPWQQTQSEYHKTLEFGNEPVSLKLEGNLSDPQTLHEQARAGELNDGLYEGGDDHIYRVIGKTVEILPEYKAQFDYKSGEFSITRRTVSDNTIHDMPLFHGTNNNGLSYSSLNTERSGQNFQGVGGNEFDGVYFTTVPGERGARTFGSNVVEARLSPDAKVISYKEARGKSTQELLGQGVDAITKYEKGGDYGEVIVLNPAALREGAHEAAIKTALAEGKGVPPEVLADYPEFAAKYAKPKAIVPEGFGAKNKVVKPDEAAKLWDEFKANQIKKRGSGGLGTEDITRLVKIGAMYVEGGARELGEFTRKMVDLAGEEARAWVPILHERAVRFVDTGELHDLTGAKNALTESERVFKGMAPVEKQLYTNQGTAYTSGRAKAESDPIYARTLATEIATKPRPLTATEVGALSFDRMQLKNAHTVAVDEIARLVDEGKDPAALHIKLAELEQLWETNDQALIKGGREQSAAFNARKMIVRDDYSLLAALKRVKVESGKAEVPEAIRIQLEDLTKRYAEAESKLGTADERIAKLEAELAFKRMERDSRKTKRATTKAELDDEFAQLKAQFAQARKENARISPSGFAAIDPEGKLTGLAGKMALNRVKAGVTTVEGIVDALYSALQDQLPGMTRRDVRDAISGYGRDPLRRTRNEMVAELAKLKTKMWKLSKSEDIASGKVEQPKITAHKKALLKNITDLQQRIESGQYEMPKRVPPTYDSSVVQMVRERDKLKFEIDRLIAKQKRTEKLDIATSLRQSMMLGNIVGIAQDIVSTTGMNITATPQMIPAAMLDTIQGMRTGQRVNTILSPLELSKAISKGLAETPREAKHIAKHGLSEKGAREQEVPHEINSGKPALDAIVNVTSRVRSLVDLPNWEVGLEIGKRESAKAVALTEAKRGAINKVDVPKRAKELYGNMTLADQLDLAMGSAAQIVKMEGTQEARVRTFKQDNAISDFIHKGLSDRGGHERALPRFVFRLILPFEKAMTNYIKAGFDLSGAGVFTGLSRALINMARPERFGGDEIALRSAQRKANLAFSRGITGGAGGLLLGYTLANLGVIGDPRDSENKQKGRAASLHVGDKSFDLGWLGPFAVPLAIGAGLYHNQLEGAKLAFGRSITQAPLVRGGRQLYNYAQIAESKGTERVGTAIGQLGASLIPGVVKDVAKLTDIEKGQLVQREAKGVAGPLKAAIPGARQTLPERKADTGDLRRKSIDDLRRNPTNTKRLDDAVTKGEMTKATRKEIINAAKLSPLEGEFKGKSLEDALKAYRQYTPEQKAQVRDLLLNKWRDAAGDAQRSKKTGRMGKPRAPTVPPATLDRLKKQYAPELQQ